MTCLLRDACWLCQYASYPRATRCGGDIVTLLWFRACVCACVRLSVRPSVDLVNTIETTPLHVSLSNLADMLTMMRGWTLLILKVRGQRSRFTMVIYGNKLVNTIETKPLCISLSNLADMLTMVRGWTLLILEVKGQGHNGHIWNKLVNTIATKPLCASWSNLANMLAMVRGWTLLIL